MCNTPQLANAIFMFIYKIIVMFSLYIVDSGIQQVAEYLVPVLIQIFNFVRFDCFLVKHIFVTNRFKQSI